MAAYLSEEENLRIGVMVYDFYNARILRALDDVSSAPADVVAEAAAGTTGRAATGKAMELAEAMLANGGRTATSTLFWTIFHGSLSAAIPPAPCMHGIFYPLPTLTGC